MNLKLLISYSEYLSFKVSESIDYDSITGLRENGSDIESMFSYISDIIDNKDKNFLEKILLSAKLQKKSESLLTILKDHGKLPEVLLEEEYNYLVKEYSQVIELSIVVQNIDIFNRKEKLKRLNKIK